MDSIEYYNQAFKMISDAIFPKAETPDDPCENCEIKHISDCCGAPVIMDHLCSDCGQPCEDSCDHCDWGDKLAVREATRKTRDTVKVLDELNEIQEKYK